MFGENSIGREFDKEIIPVGEKLVRREFHLERITSAEGQREKEKELRVQLSKLRARQELRVVLLHGVIFLGDDRMEISESRIRPVRDRPGTRRNDRS